MGGNSINSVSERSGSRDELLRILKASWSANLRVCIPGIIQTFDAATQTATIQPAIKDTVTINGNVQEVNIPVLIDVPVQFPRAGGFVMTFPVKKGDECLVFFSDMCIDAWFSHGGVQPQIEKRRHDLSDGIAVLGVFSQPNKISSFSTTSVQIKSEIGNAKITVKANEIDIDATTVRINGEPIT